MKLIPKFSPMTWGLIAALLCLAVFTWWESSRNGLSNSVDLGQAESLEEAANTVKAVLEEAAAEGDNEARFVIRFELEGPQVLRGAYLGRFTSLDAAESALDAELEKTREIGNADVLVLFKLGEKDSFELVYALGVRGAKQLFSGDEPLAEESGPTT